MLAERRDGAEIFKEIRRGPADDTGLVQRGGQFFQAERIIHFRPDERLTAFVERIGEAVEEHRRPQVEYLANQRDNLVSLVFGTIQE